MTKKVLTLLTFLSFAYADDVSLCGDPNTQVDLTNSLTLQLNGDTTFSSGSVFVLTIPDLRSVDVWEVSGTVRVPYRFRLSGGVTDNRGGIWGPPQWVADDQRGVTALAFVLEDGMLTPGTLMTLQDITVWQYVSDPPGSVVLTIDFWGNLNQSKALQAAKFSTQGDRFVSCSEGTNSAPLPICRALPLIDGRAAFELDAVDPESSRTQLGFELVQLPQNGQVEQNDGVFLYRADPAFTGFDELVFTVTDGESSREGRICFFDTADEARIAFPSRTGLAFQGRELGDYDPEIMTASPEPAFVAFALDGQSIDPPVDLDALADGVHLLQAELRADSDQRVLDVDYTYLVRSRETGEIFLEHLGPGSKSGIIGWGRYGDLDLRPFDEHDEFGFSLLGDVCPAECTLSGISQSEIKASVWGEREAPWCVSEAASGTWSKMFLSGQTYLLQVDDVMGSSATYQLDLKPAFPKYAIPLLEAGDRVVMANRHACPAIIDVQRAGGASFGAKTLLAPGMRTTFEDLFGETEPGAYIVQASLPVDVVLVQAPSGGLSASAFPFGASDRGLLPHLAAQLDVWENQFVFATDAPVTLNWQYANALNEAFTQTEANVALFAFPGLPSMPNQSWARFSAQSPVCLDGTVRFRRGTASSDSALVTGVRDAFFGPFQTARSCFLPHVSADRSLFWTGFSVLNPHPTRSATVIIRGMSDSGEELAHESTTLAPQSQEICVIGSDRFVDQPDISWLRIDSSLPLQGIELFGGHQSHDYLAGFLLPRVPAAQLIFPWIVSDDQRWSGIAILNPSSETQDVQIRFVPANGSIETRTTSLAPNTKQTFLAPAGFEGLVTCQSVSNTPCLVGFALVGDLDRTVLAGYSGL